MPRNGDQCVSVVYFQDKPISKEEMIRMYEWYNQTRQLTDPNLANKLPPGQPALGLNFTFEEFVQVRAFLFSCTYPPTSRQQSRAQRVRNNDAETRQNCSERMLRGSSFRPERGNRRYLPRSQHKLCALTANLFLSPICC